MIIFVKQVLDLLRAKEPPELPPTVSGPPLAAKLVGHRDMPAVTDELTRLDGLLETWGVRHTSAFELTKMAAPQLAGLRSGTVMIPPDEYLPHAEFALVKGWNDFRHRLGGPAYIRNGYREPEYNRIVNGRNYRRGKSIGSTHMYGIVAFDCYPRGGLEVDDLATVAAELFVLKGELLRMGFGVYRGNIHIDFGFRKRFWGRAWPYISRARKKPLLHAVA